MTISQTDLLSIAALGAAQFTIATQLLHLLYFLKQHKQINLRKGVGFFITLLIVQCLENCLRYFLWIAAYHHPAMEHTLDTVRQLSVLVEWSTVVVFCFLIPRIKAYLGEHRQAIAQLERDAVTDYMTGLPNYRIIPSLRDVDYRGCIYLDCDRFKQINDNLGHETGDRILKIVGDRLRYVVGTRGVAVRLHGDEFAILLHTAEDAEPIAQLANTALREPFHVGYPVSISVAIGIATDQPLPDMLRLSEAAMRKCKCGQCKVDSKPYVLYGRREVAQHRAEAALEDDLSLAIKNGEIRVVYQPIVSLKTGRICSFEALARWHHIQRGDITPGVFIPIAERTGLIFPLFERVFGVACQQAKMWGVPVAVNVSAMQLAQVNFTQHLSALLEAAQTPAHWLHLEITESAIADDDALSTVHILNRLQFVLAIDDFGTGQSTIARLEEFPVQYLKLDNRFVGRLAEDDRKIDICKCVIDLAHSLRLRVIAEGVETEEQVEILRSLGCEFAQGYWFSKPVTASRAQELLRGQ